jgi:hypothetical protein
MAKSISIWSLVQWAAVFFVSSIAVAPAVHADDESQIKRGFEIAPVPLKLAGKNRALVGLGSYLVNTTGCNDCHTYPNWGDGGNPFKGEPEQINTKGYLAGARLWRRNITKHYPR